MRQSPVETRKSRSQLGSDSSEGENPQFCGGNLLFGMNFPTIICGVRTHLYKTINLLICQNWPWERNEGITNTQNNRKHSYLQITRQNKIFFMSSTWTANKNGVKFLIWYFVNHKLHLNTYLQSLVQEVL